MDLFEFITNVLFYYLWRMVIVHFLHGRMNNIEASEDLHRKIMNITKVLGQLEAHGFNMDEKLMKLSIKRVESKRKISNLKNQVVTLRFLMC